MPSHVVGFTWSFSLNSFGFFCQLMEAFQTGPTGLSVASHVVMEPSNVLDRARIHLLQTVENNAKD